VFQGNEAEGLSAGQLGRANVCLRPLWEVGDPQRAGSAVTNENEGFDFYSRQKALKNILKLI
jgi:hypothetical protein